MSANLMLRLRLSFARWPGIILTKRSYYIIEKHTKQDHKI